MTYTPTGAGTFRSKGGSLSDKLSYEFGKISTAFGDITTANGISRSATIVVAASDSTAKGISQSDFVCSGHNDHLIIQSALDALPSVGGKIQLLEGSFKLAATVTRAIDNVTISGCGAGTNISYNANDPCFSVGYQANWVLENMLLDFGGFDVVNGTNWSIQNVWRKNIGTVPPTLIDHWSYDNIAPRSAGNFIGECHKHPLVNVLEDIEGTGWSASTGTLTVDSDIKYSGSSSIKIVTGAGVASDITKTYDSLPDFTDCSFGFWMYTPDNTKISMLGFFVLNSGLTNYISITSTRFHKVDNMWTYVSCEVMSNTGGTPDPTAMKNIRFRVTPVTGEVATVYLDKIVFWKRALTPKGAVTFTFDDGLPSVFELAKPAFDAHNYKGVYSIVPATQTPELLEYSKQFQDDGWDVTNHSFDHWPPRSLNSPEFEYLYAQKWIADHGFVKGSRFCILHGGSYDSKIAAFLPNHIALIRASVVGVNSLPALPVLLRSYSIINTTTVATVKSHIDTVIANGTWTNLMFHNITSGTAPNEYDWTIADLTEIIEYCYSQGVEVLTYSQITDRIRATAQNMTVSGAGTLTNGTTSVNIRHGLSKAPSNIKITPTSSLGSASSIWVSSKDTGTGNLFTVSVNVNPGANVTFDWTATL